MADAPDRDEHGAIILRVLKNLETDVGAGSGEPLAAVLDLRRNRPKAKIEDLAREFSMQIGSPVSPEAFCKILQRARRRFLELLAEEGYDLHGL